jgi:hypothetical protein
VARASPQFCTKTSSKLWSEKDVDETLEARNSGDEEHGKSKRLRGGEPEVGVSHMHHKVCYVKTATERLVVMIEHRNHLYSSPEYLLVSCVYLMAKLKTKRSVVFCETSTNQPEESVQLAPLSFLHDRTPEPASAHTGLSRGASVTSLQ